jgi:aspartate/methionine/tyrosine aminotransferase
MRGYKVGLIEPCFDNIPDLLKHQGVPLQPIPEQIVFHSLSLQALDSLDIDVLWVVSPNNPTGVALNRSHLEGISSYCASRKILIVVDFCFRFFSDTMLEYDQYDVLLNSGTSFIAIEDTGKTWPTLDTKCGIVVSSEDMHESMYQAHDDLLLGVSPFSTALISEFIKDSLETGIENSLRHIPNHNRKNLVEALTQTSVVHVENLRSEIPLIWASITAEFSAVDLYKELVKRGVHVLPGNNFFWSDPAKGARYFRVSPLRSPALIAHALPLIRESLEVLQERTAVN